MRAKFMKKQLVAVIFSLLTLFTFSACNKNKTQNTGNNSVSKSAANDGETKIPDIAFENTDNEGRANANIPEVREKLEQCPDNVILETHTFGDYTVRLVGDKARTDNANFPGSIYVRALRAEVEKNGEKTEGDGRYNDTVTYASENNEYRLFEEKIGSYIDIYELDNPVIAMRYFYDEKDGERSVRKAAEFAVIKDGELYSGFAGVCEAGTGIVLNPSEEEREKGDPLALNTDKAVCRVCVFSAEEFEIEDSTTLVDREAGIRYSFDFSDPVKMELYRAEIMK